MPCWTRIKPFATFSRSKIDHLQQFNPMRNVLLILKSCLIINYYFDLFLYQHTESLDLYYPRALTWSASFLTQFLPQSTTQSRVSSLMVPWCLCQYSTPALFFTQPQIRHLIYCMVFQNTDNIGNQDDLSKHKFWSQLGSLFEMNIEFAYNCLQSSSLKKLLQTLSHFF